MAKLEKEVDEDLKCVHSGNNVTHYSNGNRRKKPDCKICDGYGADAEKYGWSCYSPKRTWRGFNNTL